MAFEQKTSSPTRSQSDSDPTDHRCECEREKTAIITAIRHEAQPSSLSRSGYFFFRAVNNSYIAKIVK